MERVSERKEVGDLEREFGGIVMMMMTVSMIVKVKK